MQAQKKTDFADFHLFVGAFIWELVCQYLPPGYRQNVARKSSATSLDRNFSIRTWECCFPNSSLRLAGSFPHAEGRCFGECASYGLLWARRISSMTGWCPLAGIPLWDYLRRCAIRPADAIGWNRMIRWNQERTPWCMNNG